MAKASSYKLVVKNGDVKYDYGSGNYKSRTVDYVQEAETLVDALQAFLDWVADETNENKVSLVFLPKGKK